MYYPTHYPHRHTPSALIFILQSFIHHILLDASISSHLHPPIIYLSHPCSCLHQLSSSSSNHLSITSLFMPPSALIFILQSFIQHILVHASISSHLHPPIIYPAHPCPCLHQLSSSSSNHLSSTSLFHQLSSSSSNHLSSTSFLMHPSALIFILQSFI